MKRSEPFLANSRVDHSVYGSGTIVETNERHTTIRFDRNGTRKFVTTIVQLAPSDTPAPVKPVRSKKTPKKKTTRTG